MSGFANGLIVIQFGDRDIQVKNNKIINLESLKGDPRPLYTGKLYSKYKARFSGSCSVTVIYIVTAIYRAVRYRVTTIYRVIAIYRVVIYRVTTIYRAVIYMVTAIYRAVMYRFDCIWLILHESLVVVSAILLVFGKS